MIYGAYELNGLRCANIYDCWRDWFRDIFPPDTNIMCVIEFKSHGKTYTERKESVREIAIKFQNADSDLNGGLSLYEHIRVITWFSRMARQYGLVEEFKENGII